MTNNEKLIDRVRKLLALASNNSNINEASLAAEKAQQLIIENSLSIVDIENEPTNFSSYEHESKVDPWRRILANQIAINLGGHCWFDRSKRGSSQGKFIFSGPNDSAQSMAILFEYIVEQLEALYMVYCITNKTDKHGKTIRSAWFAGAVSELSNRLAARKAKIEHTYDNSRALVISKQALDKYVGKQFPDLQRSPVAISANDRDSFLHGRSSSNKVQFGDSKIKNKQRYLNP